MKVQVIHMFEKWKTYRTFVDDVNIITKLFLGIALFIYVIFIHQFDVMIYSALLMFIYVIIFSGSKFKLVAAFIGVSIIFSLISSLFMIFYGDGTHTLYKLGIIHITEESLVRGLHLALRTITVSFFGIAIALTTHIVAIFYSFMQHLKVKPKVAYAFMAAFRMVPMIFTTVIQLRRALKMRYHYIHAAQYRGIKRVKHLLIPTLSQNIRRAHQLSVAMEKNGFQDGKRRTYYYHIPFTYKDLLFIVLYIAILVAAYALAQTFPITGITDVRG